MNPFRCLHIALVCLGATACRQPETLYTVPANANTPHLLQAISQGADGSLWVSGHNGTVVRSTDQGRTFTAITVDLADSLQFRDVFAFDSTHAVLLSAGSGSQSSIWRTETGLRGFKNMYQNIDDAAFFDCFDFWRNGTGLLFGDSIDGALYLMRTADSGRTWQRVHPGGLPVALPGEGAFAASGTCVRTGPQGIVLIATGAGTRPRLLASSDSGHTFTATEVLSETGDAAGWATISADESTRFLLGGNLALRDVPQKNFAVFERTVWTTGSIPMYTGAVYGSSFHPESGLLAAGPGGLMLRDTEGTWTKLDSLAYWSVEWISPGKALAAGPKGRLAQVVKN